MWALLQPDRYRAETHVILRGGPAVRLAPAVLTLANGSVVQENVKQTLRLSNPPDLSARVDKNILVIAAEAGSKERARQVGAEAAQVTTQLVAARFGSEGLQASLLDPAHVTDQTSPTPGRNLFICGLLGLVAGGGVAYVRSRRREPTSVESGVVDPGVERRLKQRVDEVAKRERALARRAGELARTEQELGRREESLERRTQDLEQRWQTLDERDGKREQGERRLAESERELQERECKLSENEREFVAAQTPPAPPPEPVPAADELIDSPALSGPEGTPTLHVLEQRVAERRGEFPDQAVAWDSYLFFLREHADADGRLPAQFGGLVWEVFSPLLD